jgi:SAM-dependent methyltransferase
VTCRICGNAEGNRPFDVREMMFGTREVFRYVLCAECGCLQIAQIPADLSRFYPRGYTSFRPEPLRRFANPVRAVLRRARYRRAVLGAGGLAGRLLHALAPKRSLAFLRPAGLRQDSRVLDVGCGSGELLHILREIGMPNLLGIDAFLERDLSYPNGLRIVRGTIDDAPGEWDAVLFNYSLEHMPDTTGALRSAAARLAAGGVVVARIPVVDSAAWERFGVHWVNLDAPRHLCLHTRKSFAIAAARAGLAVERTVSDSDDFQFRGSEWYRRGIPLEAPKETRDVFTRAQRRAWRREADQLNREGRGDLATFTLRKP